MANIASMELVGILTISFLIFSVDESIVTSPVPVLICNSVLDAVAKSNKKNFPSESNLAQ